MKIDFIVKNAYVFQTYRQCFEKKDFMVADGRIYSVVPAIHNEDISCLQDYKKIKIIDASGKYIIPGLIDIHMHIESSMTYPYVFSDAVLKYGVTSVVADPHEIANVFGMEGIETFMNQQTMLDIFYGIPSSVPSTNENIETSGASIGMPEVKVLLRDKRVVCLGEVMNYQDMISEENTKIKEIIASCKQSERLIRIEGHCPKLSHEEYNRFIFGGVDSDHTQQTAESLLQKIDLGMFVELQRKSLTKEVIDTIEQYQLYESVALVTDDTMPDDLLRGQLNEIVKKAVELGMPVEKAIYCATYTPARRMFFEDRGAIAPGKIADFVILSDVRTFSVEAVYKSGICYKENLDNTKMRAHQIFPSHFYNSVKCRLAKESDFEIKIEDTSTLTKDTGTVNVNVIQISDFGTFTKKQTRSVPVRNGVVCWQEAGLSLITIFERHGKNGNIAHGFVENAFTEKGAVATTWSHDSHNLLVIGNSVADMIKAQHTIIDIQGGYCVAEAQIVKACAKLPIGGIVSELPISELAAEVKAVRAAIEGLGYKNNNVIMSISTLALVVSPELKMTDKGLFHVKSQQFEKLLV